MARSVALSPQFGNTLVFGAGVSGRRRRAKSVAVPLPEGLRVVAVCVPDEADEAPRTRAARPAPHRAPMAARRPAPSAARSQSVRRADSGTLWSGVAGATAEIPTAGASRRAGPPRAVTGARVADASHGVQAVRSFAAPRSVAASSRKPQQAKLRLTRRGQIVLTLVATALLLAVFSLGRFSAGASGDPVPHRTVVVHTGDTLWSIAAKAAPSADPRVTVDKIRALNHLDGGAVAVGQELQLP